VRGVRYSPAVPDSSPRLLTAPERRRLRTWRAVVKTSLTLTWVCLAVLLLLLLAPRAPRGLRIAVGAVLAESFLTAVVLGALGKCPACGASCGLVSGRLAPRRCPACGAALV
jgi:hypothetical protein